MQRIEDFRGQGGTIVLDRNGNVEKVNQPTPHKDGDAPREADGTPVANPTAGNEPSLPGMEHPATEQESA